MSRYRLVGSAAHQIDRILRESAESWGLLAAERYHLLMLAAMDAVAENPVRLGSRPIARLIGLRTYQLRLARARVNPAELRVRNPRHLLVYRQGADGVVEILGFVHDQRLLRQSARRLQQDAE